MGVGALPGQPAHITPQPTALGPPVLCFSLKSQGEGWECLVGPSEDLRSILKLAGPREQGVACWG